VISWLQSAVPNAHATTRVVAPNRLVAYTALTAGTNVAIAALGLTSGVLAARLLGPQGRGELSAIQTWPGFVGMLAAMGMPETVVYYSAKDPRRAGIVLASAIIFAVGLSAPFIALGFWLMPILLHAQSSATIAAARWYLAIVLVLLTEGMMLHPLRGCGDFSWWNLMRLIPAVAWIGVLLIAWSFRRGTPFFLRTVS
jgi:Na+-driven multidrug efflux pump